MRIHALTITMMLAATAQAQPPAPQAQPPAPQAAPPAPAIPSFPELSLTLTRVVANDLRVRDWPNLARYREADRTLPATDAASRAVFMGDSITDAWQQPRFALALTKNGLSRHRGEPRQGDSRSSLAGAHPLSTMQSLIASLLAGGKVPDGQHHDS